jgi:6-phosphofructokinase
VAIPEVEETWDQDDLVRRLVAGVRRDYRYFIIVVAEGVLKRAGADWSQRLARRIEEAAPIQEILGHAMEARINSVGHIARGGSPSALDNTLAGLLGSAAADLAQLGALADGPAVEGDVMVGWHGSHIAVTPLDAVIENSPRLVTRAGELYQLSNKLMLSAGQPF